MDIGKLREVLMLLEPDNDDHWTADGLPRVEVVEQLAGDSTIDRSGINEAAAGFSRGNMVFKADPTSGGAQETSEESDEGAATAQQELSDAKEELDKAVKRHAEATKVMDAIIAKQEKVSAQTTNASDIKAFQASQQAQRAKAARGRAALAAFVKENKELLG